jgi:penicillin-binding protein 1A
MRFSIQSFIKEKVSPLAMQVLAFIRKYWQIYRAFNSKMKEKPRKIRLAYLLGKILVCIFLYLFLVDINFLWLFGKSPKINDLNDPKYEITSQLYSSDGQLIGRYYDVNRTPVKYNDISPLLIKTLVATEDSRFYNHHGIDVKSSFSVFWYMVKGKKRGGSTITQQLVKNLYKTRSNYSRGLLGYVPLVRTVIYKTKEWSNALKIELFYSKEDILTMYLNTVDFGSNAYGIHTAARTFFNTTPDKLNESQCATLVGMLKAPTLYSPVQNPENSLARRNVVLGQMAKSGIITKEQQDQISLLPLGVNYHPAGDEEGNASYFSYAVARYLRNWLKENGYDLYRDGLKIYTTVDSRMQKYAEEATEEHMRMLQRSFDQQLGKKDPWQDDHGNPLPNFLGTILVQDPYYKALKKRFANQNDSIERYLNEKHEMKVFSWHGERDTMFSHIDSIKYSNKFLHAAFIAMDPENGYIKSWVGDINFDYFKYDHVKQSKRQPGSTFKPFVYTAAIDNGYSPCDQLTDSPVTINYTENGEQKTWSPHNVTGFFSGMVVTLKYALARSINSIAVQLTKQLGWQKVIEYASKMGITSKLDNVPSVAIGSSDVSLYELVNAYCPMVNGGNRVEPILVTRIEDKDGHVIKEFAPQPKRVLSEETAFLMSQMLRGGLTEPGGTTQALFEYDLFHSKIEIGGKTGTSQNLSDGWFVGVSPKLIGGAWVGGEYRSIHFRSNHQGEGSKTALPIFGKFMEKVLKDSNFDYLKVPFAKPSVKITKNYSCHTVLPKDSLASDSTAVDAGEEVPANDESQYE